MRRLCRAIAAGESVNAACLTHAALRRANGGTCDHITYGAHGMSGRQLPIVLALGTTQTLAWASSVYLPALVADPIAHDLGISSNWIFGAYSGALVIAGLLGPRVGRQIDRVGGRPVLSISNLTLAGGLALLGFTHSIRMLMLAWLLLGIGMGYGLYDAAFGALGRIYGEAARGAITGITLIAGFASTIGWPLTALWARKPSAGARPVLPGRPRIS